MAFLELNVYSQMLEMQTRVNVIIPQKFTTGEIGIENKNEQKSYRCLYLLHGLTDDQSIWMRRTSIERYAAEYGICVVMPCGGRSFYTDMKYGAKYFSYITDELPTIIGEILRISGKREDTFIAGLSMGGYGALKAALKKPEKYFAAAGISSVANIKNELFKETLIPVFGEDAQVPDDEDLFFLAKKTDSLPVKPKIFMGVGTGDFMYEDNLRLKRAIDECSYDFTYKESEGIHNWAFWDEYIQYVLKWMFA